MYAIRSYYEFTSGFPAGAQLWYDTVYSSSGEMIFRVYLTTDTQLSENDQFYIQVNNLDLSTTSSDSIQLLNTDEFVKPNQSYPDDYTNINTFDNHQTTINNLTYVGIGTEGNDHSWLSSDKNGGEFITTPIVAVITSYSIHYTKLYDLQVS